MEIQFLYYILAAILNIGFPKIPLTLLKKAWGPIFVFIGCRRQINHKTNLRKQRSRNYQMWPSYSNIMGMNVCEC